MRQKPLTSSQKSASMHHLGPALTLAIPGSGKTTLLLHRLIELVETYGVHPESILTLTFSKASADDMSARYEERFSHLGYRFSFMTIHKFAFNIFKRYLAHQGKEMKLLEDGLEKFKILSEIYRKHHHDTLSDDDFETLSNHIGLIYNLRLSRQDPRAEQFQWKDTFEMAEAFHEYKRAHHLFDFDDMLVSAIKILEKSPNLLEQVRRKYRFIQVDEAQDTSKLQFELIELLLGEEKNLFLVADDDQSIYGFRGAFPQYLLDFPDRFKSAKVYYLDENFRSDANIVSTAAAIITANTNRFSKVMNAYHPAEVRPSVHVFDDLSARNQYLISEKSQIEGNMAILYRNKISALSVIDALERNGHPFQIKDAPIREFSHWIIQDLIAFMTLAMIPQDLESFLRIAFKTNGYISREMVNHVKQHHRGRSVFSVLVEIAFLEDYQTRTQERIQAQFDALARLRPYDAIHYIETELGYLDYLKNNLQRLGITLNHARTRLDTFKSIAKPLKSGFEFMNRIEQLKQTLKENQFNSNEKIVLSTIHGSKGLEFDQVFLIDVNPQIFPGFKATEGDALEEERRLFYVALTRAKKVLEVLHVDFIGGSYNPPSKFVEEFLAQPFADHLFNNATGKSTTG